MAKDKKFIEFVERQAELLEAEENKPRRIRYREAMTADLVNGNGRRYSASVLQTAVDELKTHLNESAGQGRIAQVLGEAEHPSDKPTGRPNLLETVVKWDEVSFDGKHVDIVGHVLETSKGQDFLRLMEGGVMPGVSMRGYGEGKTSKTPEGEKIFEVTELHITGFDPVLDPSFNNIAEWTESQSNNQGDEPKENIMSDELKQLEEKANTEKAELQKKLDEAAAKIAEGEKAQAELAESKRKAEVEAAITEACKELPFGEKLNKQFTEALKNAGAKSAEDVKTLAEAKRKEYGAIAAELKLGKMGFTGKTGVQVLGSVLEEETGIPEYARGAFEFVEAIRKREGRSKRTLVLRAESPAAVFTQTMLERFDSLFQKQLLKESMMLQEAETSDDLFLPYAISRSLIEEAFPNLVAANIFDVGVITAALTQLPFEATTGESGYTGTVTDEVVTGGAEGVWYALAHGFITFDSVVVTSNPAGTTYVEGTDYVIDYANGKIKFLAAGSINTNDVLVDYTYTAIREGEMAPIQRVKTSTSYMNIEATAIRLADQISREAIVLGLAQANWDAVARTMMNLIKQMRRKIDAGLLYMAVSAVKSVSNNKTDPWTIGTTQDDLDELVRLLGGANLIVTNRFYDPTFNLMSATRAEGLSHWDGFKTTGFPNALLNAAGFAGMVNNKPIFQSTEFPDSLAISGNKELVAHRVFKPLVVNGPYPTYDVSGGTSKLVAADQYYAEEWNTSVSPVAEKGAFVPLEEGGS